MKSTNIHRNLAMFRFVAIGRIDPYGSPADVVKYSEVQTRPKSSTPIKVLSRAESGVYSEVSDVMKTPPYSMEGEGEEEGEVGGGGPEDRPYEEVEHGEVSGSLF